LPETPAGHGGFKFCGLGGISGETPVLPNLLNSWENPCHRHQ
jgi:hypothetical protein